MTSNDREGKQLLEMVDEITVNKEIDLHLPKDNKAICKVIIEQGEGRIYLSEQRLQDLICSLIGIYSQISGIKPFGTFFKDLRQMTKEEIKEELERFLQAIQSQWNLIGFINSFESCKYRLLEINKTYNVRLDGLKIKTNLDKIIK